MVARGLAVPLVARLSRMRAGVVVVFTSLARRARALLAVAMALRTVLLARPALQTVAVVAVVLAQTRALATLAATAARVW